MLCRHRARPDSAVGIQVSTAYFDNVRISRDERQPRAYRFMLGDNSEVRVP